MINSQALRDKLADIRISCELMLNSKQDQDESASVARTMIQIGCNRNISRLDEIDALLAKEEAPMAAKET